MYTEWVKSAKTYRFMGGFIVLGAVALLLGLFIYRLPLTWKAIYLMVACFCGIAGWRYLNESTRCFAHAVLELANHHKGVLCPTQVSHEFDVPIDRAYVFLEMMASSNPPLAVKKVDGAGRETWEFPDILEGLKKKKA